MHFCVFDHIRAIRLSQPPSGDSPVAPVKLYPVPLSGIYFSIELIIFIFILFKILFQVFCIAFFRFYKLCTMKFDF